LTINARQFNNQLDHTNLTKFCRVICKCFSGEKELTDYLNSKGEILYSDLIKDEIAKVDQLLVKDSKKEGQVGGRIRTSVKRHKIEL
jgi:hypothetical protein